MLSVERSVTPAPEEANAPEVLSSGAPSPTRRPAHSPSVPSEATGAPLVGKLATTKVRAAIPTRIRPILALLIIFLLISCGWSYLLYASAAEFLAAFPALLLNAPDAATLQNGIQRYEQAAQLARHLGAFAPLVAHHPSAALLDGLANLSVAAAQIEAALGVPIRLWEGGSFAGALRQVADSPPSRSALNRATQALISAHALFSSDPRLREQQPLFLGWVQHTRQALELTPHLPALLGKGTPAQRYLVLTVDETTPQHLGGTIDRAFVATISEGSLSALLPVDLPSAMLAAAAQTPDLPSLAAPILAHFGEASPSGIIVINRHALQTLGRLAGMPPTALIACGRYCDGTFRQVQAALNVPAPKLLLFTIAALLEERHVVLYAQGPAIQALLNQWRWDGSQFVPRRGDYLMLTYAAEGSCALSPLRAAYTVDLQVGRAVLQVLSAPCASGILRVYGPFDFNDARLDDGTLLVNVDEPAEYGGYRVEYPCGATCPTLSYALPTAALPEPDAQGQRHYDLTLQRPPTSPAPQITVTVYLPRGGAPMHSPAAARVDEGAGTVTTSFDLKADESMSITFP